MRVASSSLAHLPRVALGNFPTPLMELKAFSKYFAGPSMFMKRDDMTGLAYGGNKIRKLEFLLADALEQKCNVIIARGITQSSFCRQTAGAAAKLNLPCHAVLRGPEPAHYVGELMLIKLLGTHIYWAANNVETEAVIAQLKKTLEAEGHRPYILAPGGSSVVGCLGYVEAMHELKAQLAGDINRFSKMFVACGTAGTLAGLQAGAYAVGYEGRVIGILTDPKEHKSEFERIGNKLLAETMERLKLPPRAAAVDCDDRFVGDGYSVIGKPEKGAICCLAQHEGIFLDPTYTAKATAAVIGMTLRHELTEADKVLIWHTGGSTNLLLRSQELQAIS